MKDLADLLSRRPPNDLFHYTTQTGLLGILSSEVLRATKIQYLNDSSEFQLALDITHSLIQRLLQNPPTDSDPKHLREMEEDIDSIASVNVCVISFTEDGDLLSQWRGYCTKGAGFSMGFAASDLNRLAGTSHRFFLAPCTYNPFEHKSIIQGIIDHDLERRRGAGIEFPRSESSRDLSAIGKLPFQDLVALSAPLLKDSSFKEEREWRLVSFPLSATLFDFRESSSMLLPYYGFSMTHGGETFPLQRLVVGPSPQPDLAYDAAFSLLQKYGIKECTVDLSTVPYRTS